MSKVCNKCGQAVDEYEVISFSHAYGYFSKFDLSQLKLTLCISCLDKLTDKLIQECNINPLIEYKPYGDMDELEEVTNKISENDYLKAEGF